MRSLFHSPFPCTQPPSQQPSPTATVSYSNRLTAVRNVPSPASCTHAPPAPLPSVAFRRPPAPRSRAYLDPAHGPLSPAPRAPAMPRPHPCLAPPPAPIAPHHLSTAPLLPAPIGLASSASRPPHAVARIASTPLRAAIRVTPPISLLALRRPQGPGWQEPRRMHPFFAECAKKAPFLATSARNACFPRSRWQHPRPMHPFPGAIGRFGMHGARILPPRALFRVEEPEITHGAKMLPAPPGLSAAAACGMAERALRHAARAWPACRMRAPCHLACARRPRSSQPSYTRRASPPASRPPRPAIRRAAHCGRGEPPIGLFLLPSCCPRRRIAPTDARSPAPPEPQPEPTGPRP